MKFKEKTAIITGASSGIGYAVAEILIRDGWKVALAARRTEPLEALKRLAPERVTTAMLDVTLENAPDIFLKLADELGKPELYFHAAGIGKQNRDLDIMTELNTVRTNSEGFVRMVDTAFNYFKTKGGGHIAVISSIAGVKGLGAAPAYSATKAMQNTYIQALEQLSNKKGLNVTFTDIRPGFVRTPLLNMSNSYPMIMETGPVARDIVNAIYSRKHSRIINWKFRILVFFWRMIPDCLWRHIPAV